MFYIFLPIIFAFIISIFTILKFKVYNGNEKFTAITQKIIKILVVVYACLMLLGLLLPDGFAICQSQVFLGSGKFQGHAVLRLLSALSFVVLPVAIFFKNRTIRNIAIYYSVVMSVVQIACYGDYMSWFTSMEGKGLNSLPISNGFKNFLLNEGFRGTLFAIEMLLQISLSTILALNEKHVFNVKDKKEWGNFFLTLPILIIATTPIYVPQYLFGYSNLIFKPYGIVHFLWVAVVIGLCVGLYYAFKKKDTETKWVLLFILSISLLMQYLQMFSAISLNIKRLPLQLCNIGAFFILISLITKNRTIFNFTVLINVVGVLFALASPDLDREGLFYLYNMHFIFEHTNVLVVPVLALAFGLFPRLDKKALKDCVVLFTIYFLSVWALGTMFNAIALSTGKSIFEANWMFMFSRSVADKAIPGIGKLFDINFKIGYATFYPVLQLLVYIIFTAVVVLMYYAIQLIYKIKDKISNKHALPNEDLSLQPTSIIDDSVQKQEFDEPKIKFENSLTQNIENEEFENH